MTRQFINPRVASLAPSATLAVSQRARALKAHGVDVIDLGGGDPDFPTPEPICRAAAEAMARGDTHYANPLGVPALRDAIARRMKAANGVEVDPEGVLVTPGGKAALFAAFHALLGPGDEVLLPEPAWVSYRPMIELAGATVRPIALRGDDDFRLTRDAVDAALSPHTKAIVLCTPSNPTGHLLDDSELALVAELARSRDLLVFSDEIYERVLYDGRRHVSVASLPGLAERTLTFNGCSKAYAMTGWRLGWVAGAPSHLAAIAKVSGHLFTCAASFVQAAGVAALEGPQDSVTEMVAAWRRRRDLLCDALSAIPGVRCPRPEGAFYAFADVRGLPQPSSALLAERLLSSQGVAVTPGVAFGAAGEGHLRLSFATADGELTRAVERIERFVRSL